MKQQQGGAEHTVMMPAMESDPSNTPTSSPLTPYLGPDPRHSAFDSVTTPVNMSTMDLGLGDLRTSPQGSTKADDASLPRMHVVEKQPQQQNQQQGQQLQQQPPHQVNPQNTSAKRDCDGNSKGPSSQHSETSQKAVLQFGPLVEGPLRNSQWDGEL